MEHVCRTKHPWVSHPKQWSVIYPLLSSDPTHAHLLSVQGKATGLAQIVTQKATDLGVAAGIVKADIPPKQTTEDVDKGYPETLTSGDIAGAQKAVSDIKPGTFAHRFSLRTTWLTFPPLVAFDIKPAHDVSMPSTESQGQQPGEHTGGVGSLPGSEGEQGVAVLPEERPTKATEAVHQDHHDESDSPRDKPEMSTGVSGVGVGGTKDPLKRHTQPKVRTYFRLCK